MRVENCLNFGGPWLALELVKRLGLHEFLKREMPVGKEDVPWSLTSLILVVARLCKPSSELQIAEHFYRQSALSDLLGVPVAKVDDNRLYRGLDELLPLKERWKCFSRGNTALCSALNTTCCCTTAVTSTPASKDRRRRTRWLSEKLFARTIIGPIASRSASDLVVTRCGLPLGYEVFAGNRHDSTTLQEIVETMERRYGKATDLESWIEAWPRKRISSF